MLVVMRQTSLSLIFIAFRMLSPEYHSLSTPDPMIAVNAAGNAEFALPVGHPVAGPTGTGHSPFRELFSGPMSYLFWFSMGVGKDSYMFQNFGVYPFDRLNDTERIIVLTEVAEAVSGYKPDLKCNILNESALYAVFALMKARIKKELDDSEKEDLDSDRTTIWRKRVLEAYEQVYNTNASLLGLGTDCRKRCVWNTVVNFLARYLFGDVFWEKKRLFLNAHPVERMALVRSGRLPAGYFNSRSAVLLLLELTCFVRGSMHVLSLRM